MTYELEFDKNALKDWEKLGHTIQQQLKKKLKKLLENPKIPANKLSDMPDCYKIKLRSSGYRLIYQVIDERVVVLVVAVGKRERQQVYDTAKDRLDGELEVVSHDVEIGKNANNDL